MTHFKTLSFIFTWWGFPKQIYDLTCGRVESSPISFFNICIIYNFFNYLVDGYTILLHFKIVLVLFLIRCILYKIMNKDE